MAGKNPFDKLKRVDVKKKGKLEVDEGPSKGLESVVSSAMAFLNDMHMTRKEDMTEDCLYKKAEELASKIEYSKKDISDFSGELEQFSKEKDYGNMGLYVSALVNKIITDKDTINFDTGAVKKEMDYLGFRHKKGILAIKGNVGSSFGREMNGGTVKCTVSAGTYAGACMKNGRLEIGNSADAYLGAEMSGGKIEVKKNAGDYAGYFMKNGEIVIGGKILNAHFATGMIGGVIDVHGDVVPNPSPWPIGGELRYKGKKVKSLFGN